MNIRQYFSSRLSKTLTMSYIGQVGRLNFPPRREYEITLINFEGDNLIIDVSARDYDKSDRKIGQKKSLGRHKMNLKGLVADNPTLALEFFARKADPAYFGGEASPNIKTPVMILEEKINDRIKELLDTDPFLENKETIIPPTEGSIKRFRGFMTEIPNIIFPSIFSSKTGLIRARWMEGASKTLWLSFPEKSNMPLSYSISIPRVGELGLCKINGVCLVEKDIPYIAQLMGIFIQSS